MIIHNITIFQKKFIALFALNYCAPLYDGTNFLLSGAADFDMENSDALILIKKGSSAWVEIARSDNTLQYKKTQS